MNVKNTIVYILSSTHSGSTLLDLVLSSNSRCFSLGEFARVPDKIKENSPICQVCGRSCPCWKGFKDRLRRPFYHDAAFKISGKPILIDSSKRISWINKKTKSPKVDIKVIKIIRYGLATLLKTKRKSGTITKGNIKGWVKGNKKIDSFMSKLKSGQKLTIKYEDLCNSTEQVVKKCCKFIGAPYEEGMLDFWKVKHHTTGGNSKPIDMVRLYFDMVKLDDLHPDVQDFFSRNGFSLNLDSRFVERFSKSEVELFNRTAGKFCQSYGYELIK